MSAFTDAIRNGVSRLKKAVTPKFVEQKRAVEAMQKRKDEVIGLIKNYPETFFLLQLAHEEKIGIGFDPEMDKGDTAGELRFDPKSGQQYIALAPGAPAEHIAFNLIHELRHVWQNKVLGLTPQTMNIADKDPETALVLSRVREADAYAFSNLILRRMEASQKDNAEAQLLFAKISQSTGKPPDEFQMQMVTEFMTEKFASRLAHDQREMDLDFRWALQNVDGYDRRALLAYHERYTSPQLETQPRPDTPFGLGDIRRLLVMGVNGRMPGYLGQLSDDQFKAVVLNDVAPALKDTADLMQAFEKAAKRGGLSKQDDLQRRGEIHQSLSQAVNTPPPPHTPSRY